MIREETIVETVLKERTESLCPVCLERVPARVLRDGAGVCIEQICPRHGRRRALIERDAEFFSRALSLSARAQSGGAVRHPRLLTILPTSRCNIACNVCYMPCRDESMEMSLDEIAGLMDRWPHDRVSFAGGEPTVLPHLPRLLALAREKGKAPSIVTNGLRLADRSYVRELARNGLAGVSLSLNGLNREALKATDGGDYLDAKRQAAANLRKEHIPFGVCFTLVKGVNERDLADVLRFTLEQYPVARSFHAECLPRIGRCMNPDGLFLSEMLELFARAAGVSRDRLIELAEAGRSRMGVYAYAGSVGDILFAGGRGARTARARSAARTVGWTPVLRLAAARLVRPPSLRFRVHSWPAPPPTPRTSRKPGTPPPPSSPRAKARSSTSGSISSAATAFVQPS